MQQFLENNWLSILSIFIGIVVAYLFYRLQKKDSASAADERKKRATAELLDVVETFVINKQRLSEPVIDNLIHASERDHMVALRPTCTATTLLQDVALRLQRSRHLDIPQKSEYSEKLDQLIQEIRSSRARLRVDELDEEIGLRLKTLLELVPQDRRAEADGILDSTANLMKRRRDGFAKEKDTSFEVFPVTAALIGAAASVASALIGTGLTDSLRMSALISSLEKVLPAMGAFLAAVVTLAAIVTALRIKRRTAELKEPAAKTDA